MSKMCTMESCKAKEGLCTHEKAMIVIVAIVIIVAVAKQLNLF